jgi:hypothetical protein
MESIFVAKKTRQETSSFSPITSLTRAAFVKIVELSVMDPVTCYPIISLSLAMEYSVPAIGPQGDNYAI